MPKEALLASLKQAKLIIETEAAATDRNAVFPEKSLKALGSDGWMGLLVPQKFGGMEANARQFVDVIQSIAGACGSTGMIYVMHNCAVAVVKDLMKDSPEKSAIMQAMAKGAHLSTLACSERGTGTHFYASYSRSKKQQDGSFALTADKCFVTSASFADSYVVSTQADGAEDPITTSLYLVNKASKGQEFNGSWDGMGLRGNNSCVMNLKECVVPENNLLGEAGQGLSLSMSVILPRFLLGTAAVYSGIARAAYDACVEHVKGRTYTHTQEALSALPTMRRQIAEMKVSLDACQKYLEYVADEFDATPANPELLILLFEAKQMASKTAREVCLMAMQSCGGIAYSGALPIERFMRDAMAGAVMAPSSDVLLDLIGKHALGQPLL